jgi:hypothetical protein
MKAYCSRVITAKKRPRIKRGQIERVITPSHQVIPVGMTSPKSLPKSVSPEYIKVKNKLRSLQTQLSYPAVHNSKNGQLKSGQDTLSRKAGKKVREKSSCLKEKK